MATRKEPDKKTVDKNSDKPRQIASEFAQINIAGGDIVSGISNVGRTKPNILFVASDPDLRATRSEFLQRAGYEVITASNLHEAKNHTEYEKLELAIIDIEILKDDGNDQDQSGAVLAQALPGSLPKIILSKFPAPGTAQDALRVTTQDELSNIGFISADDGLETLLAEISRILGKSSPTVPTNAPLGDQKPQTVEKPNKLRTALKEPEIQIYIIVFFISIGALIWLSGVYSIGPIPLESYAIPLLAAGYSAIKIMSRLAGDASTDAPLPKKKKKQK